MPCTPKTICWWGADGVPNHPQPAGKLIDLDELGIADGWMRATAPSGRAAYEGVVSWTPSAGVGVRPPEQGQSAPAEEPEEDEPEEEEPEEEEPEEEEPEEEEPEEEEPEEEEPE